MPETTPRSKSAAGASVAWAAANRLAGLARNWRSSLTRGASFAHVHRWEIDVALVAGLLGGIASLIVMGVLRLWWGTLTPPELVGERVLPLFSAQDFVSLLVRFKPNPKTEPLGLTLLGQIAIGMLIALPVAHFASPDGWASGRWPARRGWIAAGVTALLMEVVALALFWPVLPAGIYGDPYDRARLLSAISLLLTFSAYAIVTVIAYHWLSQRLLAGTREPQTPYRAVTPMVGGVSRRAALEAGGVVVLSLAVGAIATERLLAEWFARSNLAYEGMRTPANVTSAITPTSDFYVVSKNVLDPTVQVERWRLELTGLVRTPTTWDYARLLRMPSESRAVTLECISNEVGGHLISTAQWRGVTLAALLTAGGGTLPNATHVIFYGVDGYSTSLPLDALLQARTLLAWEMNGHPLPDAHGFPLRAVVAGRYGEQSAKWVTRIELADHEFKGFYQSQGWSAGPLSTMSRIDAPSSAAAAFGPITVAGIVFGGLRAITRVELSADNGQTWHEATLTPPLSNQTWTLWRWVWRPAAPGRYTLVVRATDSSGERQLQQVTPGVPNGATGLHSVQVVIK